MNDTDLKDAVKAAFKEMSEEQEREWAKQRLLTPPGPSYEHVRNIARREAQTWAYWAFMGAVAVMILRVWVHGGTFEFPFKLRP
jgi:hypothetical protein